MSQGQHPTHQLLMPGIAQAAGFLVGALLGRWLGLALGFDALGAGYGNGVIVGIVLIALGGGGGVQLARAWYTRKYGPEGMSRPAAPKANSAAHGAELA